MSARIREGEGLRFAVREFLDEFQLLPRGELMERAIRERPALTGSAPADAYLGALGRALGGDA